MILVRADQSGIYFLVRSDEEESALATIAFNFPGMPVETIGREGELLLVHLVREPRREPLEASPPPSLRVVALPVRAGESGGCRAELRQGSAS